MIIDQTIEAFLAGELAIDFPKIRLQQCVDSDPSIFSGPGKLRQAADKSFELVCRAVATPPTSIIRKLVHDLNVQPGQLYRAEAYYEFSGRDERGSIWAGGRSLVRSGWSAKGGSTLTAGPRSLSMERQTRKTGYALQLVFIDQDVGDWAALEVRERRIDLPSRSLSFLMSIERRGDSSIVVRTTSQQKLPRDFEFRLVESLRFVLGLSLQPVVIDETRSLMRKLILRAPRPTDGHGAHVPPVDTSSADFTEPAIELLRCYLEHGLAQAHEGVPAPSSEFLSLAQRLGTASLDSWEIGLGIAVEGLAKEIAWTPTSNKSEHDRLRKEISAWMRERKFSDALIERTPRLLSMLDSVRPEELMASLVPTGHALASDIKEWRDLRNRAVHTRKVKADDGTDERTQIRLDRIHKVTRLLFNLTFHKIGYSGLFADRGAHGFPPRSYPFKPDSKPSEE